MIRILFIDDDLTRSQELSELMTKYNINCSECDYVQTKVDALKLLCAKQYDLIVIDIMLPDSMSKVGISENAGIEILKAIHHDSKIKKPLFVIGLTSNEETYNKSKEYFNENIVPLSIWQDDEEWKLRFISKIKYLIKLSSSYVPINSLKVDIALITAVSDEYNALEKLPIEWNDLDLQNDPGKYSIGQFVNMLGNSKKILRTCLPEMGIAAASSITTKIIEKFDPNSIIMVGICGGRKGEVELGDLIIAERSWDYGSGKIKKLKDGSTELLAQPNQITISAILKSNIEKNMDLLSSICSDWNSFNHQRKNTSLKIGALPSGSAVISTSEYYEKNIAPQYRKFLGMDMETYGVYYSCSQSGKNINFVSMKSVSDLADEDKDDTYHDFCSYISGMFAYKLLEKGDVI